MTASNRPLLSDQLLDKQMTEGKSLLNAGSSVILSQLYNGESFTFFTFFYTSWIKSVAHRRMIRVRLCSVHVTILEIKIKRKRILFTFTSRRSINFHDSRAH